MTQVPRSGRSNLSRILERQTAELESMLDNMPLAVVSIDQRQIHRYVNPLYGQLFNPARHELSGLHLEQGIGGDAYQVIRDIVRQGLTGTPGVYDRELWLANRQRLYVELSLIPTYDDYGRVKLLYLLFRDMTEQRCAEQALRDSEQRHMLAAYGAADGLWDWNPVSKALYVSPRLLAILGYPDDFRIQETHTWQLLLHPDDRAEYNRKVAQHLKQQTGYFEHEFRVRTAQGPYRWVHSRGLASWNDVGIAMRMAGSISDISERKRTETALQQTTDRLNLALQGSNLVLWDFDLLAGELYLDKTWSIILGGEPQETVTTFSQLLSRIHGDDHAALIEMSQATLKGTLPECNIEYRICDNSGRWLWIHARGKVTERDQTGKALRMTGTSADITARKQAEQRIHYLATRDALTDLPNRLLFSDRLQRALAHAHRHQNRLAVIFVDLDHFKHINDSLGHHAGDRLLREVASRLQSCLRSDDTVARQGGDEFIVLLTDIDELQPARVAEKILDTIAQPLKIEHQELVVCASLGIAVYPDDGLDKDELLRNADTAMYHAKAAGRAAYQFFKPSMNQAAQQRLTLEVALRQAIDRQQFVLHFQPQIELSSGRIHGCETLIRWQHPHYGLIPPGRFIAIAEEIGLIDEIGLWVLDQACQQVCQWRQRGHHPLRIAVNVSARQFRKPTFTDRIINVLNRTQLPCQELELEITETLLMDQSPETLANMSTLDRLGVRLAVDDFGTGYASMTYLKKLPVHRVKIDRSFVRDVISDPGDAAIVRAITTLGHDLGMDVVAEGVETAEQLALLKELGCDFGQGYYFARPLPAERFEQLLINGCR